MRLILISPDVEAFRRHLDQEFQSAGFFDVERRLGTGHGPDVYIVDGRQLATETPAGAQVPRPDEIPANAPVRLWLPSPLRLSGTAPWATLVNQPQALLLGLIQEHWLAPFRAPLGAAPYSS